MAKSKTLARKPKSKMTDHVVYVGPNVPGGVLSSFQAFRGGFPPYIQEALNERPQLKDLFVPVEELAGARAKIEDPKTPLALAYRAAVESMATKGGRG